MTRLQILEITNYTIAEFNMSLEEISREDREIEQILREDIQELFPNLDKFSEMISLYVYNGKSHKSNSHTSLLECFSDMDRMDTGTMDP